MLETLSTTDLMYLLEAVRSSILRRAESESWQYRPRAGQGGGKAWIIVSMPKTTRHAIGEALISKPFPQGAASAPAVTSDAPSLPSPACPASLRADSITQALADTGHLTEKQRAIMAARKGILNEVCRLATVMSKRNAILALEKGWREGTLDEGIRQKAIAANDKVGGTADRGLSYPTIYRWLKAFEKGGELALAPKHPGPDMRVPEWFPAFLPFYQKPQNPKISEAYREFKKGWSGVMPSESQVRRMLEKMPVPDREWGRKTGNAHLKLRPHKRRDASIYLPGDIYTADGTTFDAEVLNPLTGKPFKPEITFVLDVVTRRCVGLSVGLSESALVVLDALRMACQFAGIPAMFYTDNGSGYANQLMTTRGAGMMDRLGIELTHSIPGRPQGKGLMERGVQTLCGPLSKMPPTCTHADMDPDAGKMVFKLTRKHIKEHGASPLMPTWQQFKPLILARVEEYNNTLHRGLKKIVDLTTGRLRHPSPNEAWESFRNSGWEPFNVPEALRDELFMPAEHRKVRNGEVQALGGRYFSNALADFHGDIVEVRYDVWDSSKVYIWTTTGQRICNATLDGNVIPYFPPSRVEVARAKREKAQLARLGNKVQSIAPGATIQFPETPSTYVMMADSITRPQSEPSVLNMSLEQPAEATPQVPTRRPVFGSPNERYMWLMRNRDRWTSADYSWVEEYVQSECYADLYDYYLYEGLAWEESVVQAVGK
ncbi:bacteriophage transposase A protein [Desulfovibrio sp. DV]|uniref:Mu transposase C-terminal domain-containing protein n=1 Tax=Desulfovibrio sp. DV TaxID=1844708 RepID=UPI00094B7D18|nr:bacteriophage transposase A protein [Desulfovibrio sp. DV]